MKDKILITTAIDYANDVIHIGHAYQKVLADCFARYYRILGKQVFFVTGTDEHGANIEKIANSNGKDIKDYVDYVSGEDQKQIDSLGVKYDRFIRTTDLDHKEVVNKIWKIIFDKGDIYKKSFTGLYCLSCESFKTGSEIEGDCCNIHKTLKLIEHKEENYFFKWSSYQKFLEEFFQKNKKFVLPQNKYNEMFNFLKSGIEDISISRQNIKWGIKVPRDETQVIYVWFDALINYYTAGIKTGFWDENTTIIHFLGKDNLRWHSLLWPAILKSADLKTPDIVYSHDFINIDGQKISKTLGNIIRPSELVEEFDVNSIRYFLLKRGPLYDDVDISKEKIKEVNNSDLANGLGNLIQRITKICEKISYQNKTPYPENFSEKVIEHFDNFRLDLCLEYIQEKITEENRFIEMQKLWTKEGEELIKNLDRCIINIRQIAFDLQPFMPDIAEKIKQRLGEKILFGEALFKRI
ncbi:MAG: methionine--tRNA ligase [Patescibacteria group bacterium]|nr:methionine--tRNA ligase [Patescibacteria group bacterium]